MIFRPFVVELIPVANQRYNGYTVNRTLPVFRVRTRCWRLSWHQRQVLDWVLRHFVWLELVWRKSQTCSAAAPVSTQVRLLWSLESAYLLHRFVGSQTSLSCHIYQLVQVVYQSVPKESEIKFPLRHKLISAKVRWAPGTTDSRPNSTRKEKIRRPYMHITISRRLVP